MKISVITIAFNSAETIKDTIESVLAQDYADLEYIIVDGASKDATIDIVKSYGNRISKFVSEKDKGIYDAMNKGLSLATGDVIGILNSDDFYADNRVLSEIADKLEESGADGVYADLVYVDRAKTDKIVRKWVAGSYRKGLFLKGWMPPHPTFFVSRRCYEKYGAYNLELRSAADYELMLRFIHKYEIKIAYLPRIITRMRLGGQSNISLKNRIKANVEDRKAWKINGLKPKSFTLIRKPLSKLKQYLK